MLYLCWSTISFCYNEGTDANPDWHQVRFFDVYDTNGDRDAPVPPIDTYVVSLDADKYPMNAAVYGGIEVISNRNCMWSSSEPNPKIEDIFTSMKCLI